jgi:curved DNA-binding protein CbpA
MSAESLARWDPRAESEAVMDPEPDLYAILGVPPTASDHAITLAYRGQIKRVHPDYATHDADRRRRTVASATLNDAYAVLGDPLHRVDYDLRRARRAAEALRAAVEADDAAMRAAGAPLRADAAPASDRAGRTPWATNSSDPSDTAWTWLRATHEGQWVALVLAGIAIWLFGLAIALPQQPGPDLTLLAAVLLAQPVLAGRWRATPLADLVRAVKRAMHAGATAARLLFVRLAGHVASGGA